MLTASISAAAPDLLTYQGRLKEGGQAVSGNRAVEILLCDSAAAGNCRTSGTQSVMVSNGLFRSTFTVPATADLRTGDWYMEIWVAGTRLLPRERLTSSAYALFSGTAAYAANLAAAPGSAGIYASSDIYLTAGKYHGDGSALTGILGSGDGLGDHIATTTLQMGAYGINSTGDITAGRYQINGNTVLSLLPGSGSIGIGVGALGFNRTGSANSVTGYQAGYGAANTSFSSSTIMGYQAGYALSTGSNNLLLGFRSGDGLTTGSGNIIIGYDQDAPTPATSNYLNIGGVIFGDLSTGKVGIGTTAPTAALEVSGNIKVNGVRVALAPEVITRTCDGEYCVVEATCTQGRVIVNAIAYPSQTGCDQGQYMTLPRPDCWGMGSCSHAAISPYEGYVQSAACVKIVCQ